MNYETQYFAIPLRQLADDAGSSTPKKWIPHQVRNDRSIVRITQYLIHRNKTGTLNEPFGGVL